MFTDFSMFMSFNSAVSGFKIKQFFHQVQFQLRLLLLWWKKMFTEISISQFWKQHARHLSNCTVLCLFEQTYRKWELYFSQTKTALDSDPRSVASRVQMAFMRTTVNCMQGWTAVCCCLDMGVTPVLKIRLTWDFSDSLFHSSRKNNFQLTWKFSDSLFRLEWL